MKVMEKRVVIAGQSPKGKCSPRLRTAGDQAQRRPLAGSPTLTALWSVQAACHAGIGMVASHPRPAVQSWDLGLQHHTVVLCLKHKT